MAQLAQFLLTYIRLICPKTFIFNPDVDDIFEQNEEIYGFYGSNRVDGTDLQ